MAEPWAEFIEDWELYDVYRATKRGEAQARAEGFEGDEREDYIDLWLVDKEGIGDSLEDARALREQANQERAAWMREYLGATPLGVSSCATEVQQSESSRLDALMAEADRIRQEHDRLERAIEEERQRVREWRRANRQFAGNFVSVAKDGDQWRVRFKTGSRKRIGRCESLGEANRLARQIEIGIEEIVDEMMEHGS